eukprot:jgi/Chlat1/792/Chrsp104S01257
MGAAAVEDDVDDGGGGVEGGAPSTPPGTNGNGAAAGGGGGGQGGADAVDSRIDWIEARVCTSLRCKEEKFARLKASEDGKAALTDFLEQPECTLLMLSETGKGGELAAFKHPPVLEGGGRKHPPVVYFIKTTPRAPSSSIAGDENGDKVTGDSSGIIHGVLVEGALEQLQVLSQEVFLPLLSNPRNHDGWPEVIAKEVIDNLHKFVAGLYVTIGQTKGKTLLPLPPLSSAAGNVASSNGSANGANAEANGANAAEQQRMAAMRDKDRVHVLESAVVTWTRQIKNVLKTDPEAVLKEDGVNPGPLAELEFWTAKAANLNSIHEQLSSEKVRKVVRALELAKSTYFPAFNRLCREVALGRLEANDNLQFLKPLRKYFERLNSPDADFLQLAEMFKPIMHLLLLVWKHSKYYNTAARLVILMREICNDLIAAACRFVNSGGGGGGGNGGSDIFRGEPAEAVDKLKATLKICGTFKSHYFDYKAKTAVETPENPWRFQNSALFARLDSFLERCHDILDLAQTVVQFGKLEKIEIGGTKGKTLTTSVRQIYADFLGAVQRFGSVAYNIMDVENKRFDDDFYEFRCVIKELERRLGSVITQAFDDCATISATFKLLDSFEGLLEREIITSDLERKHADLLRSYAGDLKDVHDTFTRGKEAPFLARNHAPRSGAVSWVRGLAARIEEPMSKLKALTSNNRTTETEEAKEVAKQYAVAMAALAEYERLQVEDWAREIEATSEDRLKQPLLRRDDAATTSLALQPGVELTTRDGGASPFVKVNFDSTLVRLLREVKYFLLLGIEVPESALRVYKRAETFRQQTGNLELIVNTYNGVLVSLLPVEKPLVERKLEAADGALMKGLRTLSWNSHKIEEYITDVMIMVKELAAALGAIKSNVKKTRGILKKWEQSPLIERKEGKVYAPEEFTEVHRTLTAARSAEIAEGGAEIAKLLAGCNKTLKVSKGAPAWKAFAEYVHSIVARGLVDVILASSRYLFEQLDPDTITRNEGSPLLEVRLELVAPEILWHPDIGESGASGGGIRDLVNAWLKGFIAIGALTRRLDGSSEGTNTGNYVKELEEDSEICGAFDRIHAVVLDNEKRCAEFKDSYLAFEYLWKRDLQATLNEFLASSGDINGGEPPLEAFDAQIAKFKAVQEEITALPASATIGWLRVDAKPIKQALSTWVTKWVFLFTHHLSNKIVVSMDDLYAFMASANQQLDVEVREGDAADLYTAMGCMRGVRIRSEPTEAMFDPLRATVALLRKYGITLGEQTLKRLDEAPITWQALKKKMFQVREKLSSRQQEEAAAIREASEGFKTKVDDFRAVFKKKAPFGIPEAVGVGGIVTTVTNSNGALTPEHVVQAREVLEAFRGNNGSSSSRLGVGNVAGVMKEAAELNERQELFEAVIVDYRELAKCEEELALLSELWDAVAKVMDAFAEWRSILWEAIDVAALTEKARTLAKDVKSLNKAVRSWDAYRLLEDAVKAILVALPLVGDLHHPSMRERHWKQLMRATGIHFVMDDKFNLGNLLDLKLHEYVDAVSEIVDRAQKELTIERLLKRIDETWSSLALDFAASSTDSNAIMTVSASDAVVEALESDQLQLQTMSAGKYVQGNPKFLEEVTRWQRRLGGVDAGLAVWLQVQKKWTALEAIFVGGGSGDSDIRARLPEDAKRFDATDTDWRDLMRTAVDTPNVVEACNVEGRQERLEKMLTDLQLCEKALADYLETKRLAFPRFYFISPGDLLDILSKGASNPRAVLKHLSKCFDNMHNLRFTTDTTTDDNSKPAVNINVAVGMESGEGEYVSWHAPFTCEGPVEAWLAGLLEHTKEALRRHVIDGMNTYDERPREKWLLEQQSAQMAVVVTRIVYAQEVGSCFDAVEDAGGDPAALKEYNRKCQEQLDELVRLTTQGSLTSGERRKVITLCTVDTHARDVVAKLIDDKVESSSAFQWQSQLRYTLAAEGSNSDGTHDPTKHCRGSICDFDFPYQYEYAGNAGCLVLTPLTDRCYITLTQAQRLILGGAPAGPAGTGKTETVKDLGRALGVMVYVFNCSDQMDYRTMGGIYKGLAQTGAWGCFDEFNRIPVEVLSVCSTQYKCVLDALRARKERFVFVDGDEIVLKRTVCAFITMNPSGSYGGRTELPESLKALFRPVAMAAPDLSLIAEIMLLGEGFVQSKTLARKAVILYTLCQDLLSKQAHYDWKLRALKATLGVAGAVKRAAPQDAPEDKLLLRALRDSNAGKLVAADAAIFAGLLNDLFPRMGRTSSAGTDRDDSDADFDTHVQEACTGLNLRAEPRFMHKVHQLREALGVRWSVFLLGPAGCGKSSVWKTLARAQSRKGEKTVVRPINPKSVTRNELYGYLHPQTREWREGLISVTFRDMAGVAASSTPATRPHQWILFDGDLDAEWVESMNTVMDDNKMLTLASNERIPLAPGMRLLFEVHTMRHASPATVSRGGVVYLNEDDVGWEPLVETWIESREDRAERAILAELFSRYMEKCLNQVRKNHRTVVPLPAVNQTRDCRLEFSNWWRQEWAKHVAIPAAGTVFDYYVETSPGTDPAMAHWGDRVPSFQYVAEHDAANAMSHAFFVPTIDTTRLSFLLDALVGIRSSVMLVGGAGTGKTSIVRERLRALDPEAVAVANAGLNSLTTSAGLQAALEAPLERKSGSRYGPPGARRLIWFVDDLNMPAVDKYDTQAPVELLRQFADYGGWYDRAKVMMKEVMACQLVACLNPAAGSFSINPRAQRQFATFAVQMPSQDQLLHIYTVILAGHVTGFEPEVARLGPKVAAATIELHAHVGNTFLPTATKFHYVFNLRELSAVAQGVCRAQREFYSNPIRFARLWLHECERVFGDRMVNEIDSMRFGDVLDQVRKKHFEDLDHDAMEARPVLYTAFANPSASGDEDAQHYLPVDDHMKLKRVLEERLAEYNEGGRVAAMDLVLFDAAVEHVARIARAIGVARGSATLVGVGGSGKQSLARLATHVCGYGAVTQLASMGSNNHEALRAELAALCQLAGVKGTPVVLLVGDAGAADEQLLVHLSDLLSSGNVLDLFPGADERDSVCTAVRGAAKLAGVIETRDNCWDFFVDRVRRNLHVILCFSPAGDRFRIRARQFPALLACTTIDWFHPWPHEALVSVAARFLTASESTNPNAATRATNPNSTPRDHLDGHNDNAAHHMAFVHAAAAEAAARFWETERRHVYVTPKSFLDLIGLHARMLTRRRTDLHAQKERLEGGLLKVAQASAQVADLQVALRQEQAIVAEKRAATDALIVSIGQEKAVVDEQKAGAAGDEEECARIAAEVAASQAECERDLAEAEPIIREAEAALDSLDKKALGELKSFGSPAAEVVQVGAACLVLTAPGGKVPKDLSWNAAKKMMGNVDGFLSFLRDRFDKESVPLVLIEKCEADYLSNPNFNPDFIRSKSAAAAGLCGWVVNICKYFRIYQVVAPKRAMLAEANRKLEAANARLQGVRSRVAELEARVRQLEEALMRATSDKNAAVAAAERTQRKADLADRLVNGLAGENARWSESLGQLGEAEERTNGDALVAAAFVAYAGPFNAAFRHQLVYERWAPDLEERGIPASTSSTATVSTASPIVGMLAEPAEVARWVNEGLPADAVSAENGAIMTSCVRWPLMIDPQLQGVRWVKAREQRNGLRVVQISSNQQSHQHNYLREVEHCITNGVPLLIENLGETVDAALEPVLSRSVLRRGRTLYIRLGDKEIEYDPNFRLYLHTKLSNPHYGPEVSAQTTLVNFSVTERGLEEQLLALVVNKERPDLEEQLQGLVRQLNEFKIALKELEDALLARLSNAQGDILEDTALVENLEETKRAASDVETRVALARETEAGIAEAREVYRPVAARGALLFFLVDRLHVLDHAYRYSMAAFVNVMSRGMDEVGPPRPVSSNNEATSPASSKAIEQRVSTLIDASCFAIFRHIAAGLFERHKLIFAAQLSVGLLRQRGELHEGMFEYLLQGPRAVGQVNPMPEWISGPMWGSVQALKDIEEFRGLPDDIIGSAKRWRDWCDLERPEDEPLPGDWKRLPDLGQLLVIRALRPDRATSAVANFVGRTLGERYARSLPLDLDRALADAPSGAPIFIFLSPGVDAAASVERVAVKKGVQLAVVSLGQGQEDPAMRALERARSEGSWVLLQNIHLTPSWTAGPLQRVIDSLSAHVEKTAAGDAPSSDEKDAAAAEDQSSTAEEKTSFKLFLSAEPTQAIPIGVLQASAKVTNEPPEGVQPNLARAYNNFSDDFFDACTARAPKFKAIVFALSLFHGVVLERKKFGPQGWNNSYPFNTGDLLNCAQCAANYLETAVVGSKVPWDDLRFIFGEIMYGGHVTDDWDRRTVSAYLMSYMREELLEGCDLFPRFHTPPGTNTHAQNTVYILEAMPGESPVMFGLHSNAEIGFRLAQTESLFRSVITLQQAGGGAGGAGVQSLQDRAKTVLDDVIEKLPEPFALEELAAAASSATGAEGGSQSQVAASGAAAGAPSAGANEVVAEQRSPFAVVFLQEAERMNHLVYEIRRSLLELDLGLKGDLTMSDAMEGLVQALAEDRVPASWEAVAYPSLRPLGSWIINLLERNRQIAEWAAGGDYTAPPRATWLSGLFNPQSFLTAVMQTTARRNDWPLDRTVLVTEVTKKHLDGVTAPSREGAFVHGLVLEGCGWDEKAGLLVDSRPKELFNPMPVILVKAVPLDKAEQRDTYLCPVYKTQKRGGPGYVFTAQLRTKLGQVKWVLAGVAMLLEVVA